MARAVLRADPSVSIWLGRDRIPVLARTIAEVVEREAIDLVQITHGELADLLPAVRPPTGLLLFDALARANQTRVAFEPLRRRRAQLWVEGFRTRRFERQRYRLATGVASVSAVDAAWLEAVLGRPIEVLQNPIGAQLFDPPTVPRSGELVTFVGALTHHPNRDAILWLAHEIWPTVVDARPDARLRVVGRADGDPNAEELRDAVARVGGEVLVDVPDIRPHYWEAAVVVAPLRHGSGLRNKVIHAMACGAPVVATTAALEGIPEEAVALVQQADTAAAIASAIVRTLEHPADAATRAAEGRDAVASLHIEAVTERHARWWGSLCR
jgi:glycosyltransferase involved in cell wall biosynthesis